MSELTGDDACPIYIEEECPICYETLKHRGKTITDCGHEFCTQCFIRHIRAHNSCPMCRQDLLIVEPVPALHGPAMHGHRY